MKVGIISAVNNPLFISSICARTCYRSRELHNKDREKDFVRSLIKRGHLSTLENVTIVFSVEGISRACLAQITRHRHASFCVESQRYVKYNTDTPWAENKQYRLPGGLKTSTVEKFKEILSDIHIFYNEMIASGVLPEDARMILPQCFLTNMTMSVNLRELRHIFALRTDSHAQLEIAELCYNMYKELVSLSEEYAVFFEDIINEKK